MPHALEFLLSRHSTPSRLLGEPGPSQAELDAMLGAAVHVPDHGKLTPWRFLLIRGAARQKLGDLLVATRQARPPEASDEELKKDRQRFNFAPLVIAVIARVQAGHKIPEQEQLLSGGCAAFSLLLAAQGLGYGAQWLTGWAAYDRGIASRLGLADEERVLGFIHIGTASEATPDRLRPDALLLTSDWHG